MSDERRPVRHFLTSFQLDQTKWEVIEEVGRHIAGIKEVERDEQSPDKFSVIFTSDMPYSDVMRLSTVFLHNLGEHVHTEEGGDVEVPPAPSIVSPGQCLTWTGAEHPAMAVYSDT